MMSRASLSGKQGKSYFSHKWIESAPTGTGQSSLVVNSQGLDSVFTGVGSSPCNLISIFGRARQGKSFLMNCLSGEQSIFRVSNEKESVSGLAVFTCATCSHICLLYFYYNISTHNKLL